MSVALSILAMVAQGPRYGYQLRVEFDRRTGTRWPLNVGQVYKTLDRLERDGLVTKAEATDADGHLFYEATDSGLERVHRWLTTADVAADPSRDDLAVKLAIAVTLPGVDIGALLSAQRDAALVRLQALTREAGSGQPITSAEALSGQLVADAVQFAAEAQLRWLDHVRERVRQAQAAGLDLTLPFDTELPRRGRPRAAAKQSEAAGPVAPSTAPAHPLTVRTLGRAPARSE